MAELTMADRAAAWHEVLEALNDVCEEELFVRVRVREEGQPTRTRMGDLTGVAAIPAVFGAGEQVVFWLDGEVSFDLERSSLVDACWCDDPDEGREWFTAVDRGGARVTTVELPPPPPREG